MTTTKPVLVTTLAGDPLRLLLRDPALVIATDPCPAHRARLELRTAALKCLGARDYAQLGARWGRLLPRFRWLVSDEAWLAWDGDVAATAPACSPSPAEFDAMKERATRMELVSWPLDDLLSGLPAGFANGIVSASACEADPARLLEELRRACPHEKNVIRHSPIVHGRPVKMDPVEVNA